jgi:hypothetical protein
MPIAPRQPHRSWYRRVWYARRSPHDALIDRTLIFAIVTLTLLAGGMLLVRHGTTHRGASSLHDRPAASLNGRPVHAA